MVARVLQGGDHQINRPDRRKISAWVRNIQSQGPCVQGQGKGPGGIAVRVPSSKDQIKIMVRVAQTSGELPANEAVAPGDDDTAPHSDTAMRNSPGKP